MKYLLVIFCVFLISGGYSATFDSNQWLHDLSGEWKGNGFTMIAIPDISIDNPPDFVLKSFHTHESLVFSCVRDGIRNAGDKEADFFSSLHYLHQVTDLTTHGELHLEPGVWIHQPADELGLQDADGLPLMPDEVWRAGNVPHGVTFLAGAVTVLDEKKPPVFEEGFTTLPFPFGEEGQRKTDPDYVGQYLDPDFPPSMVPMYSEPFLADDGETEINVMINPTQFLAIDNLQLTQNGQSIVSTKTVFISSVQTGPSLGGVLNIPGLNPITAANVSQLETRFYISKCKDTDGSFFYRMQYVQEVYINFFVPEFPDELITWPHVSVATLRKVAGEYVS